MPLSREHILEAALLTAKKPVSVRELRRLFDDELSHADVLKLLESLSAFWQERGLRLREVAGGWRMETAPEATPFLFKLKDEDRPSVSPGRPSRRSPSSPTVSPSRAGTSKRSEA